MPRRCRVDRILADQRRKPLQQGLLRGAGHVEQDHDAIPEQDGDPTFVDRADQGHSPQQFLAFEPLRVEPFAEKERLEVEPPAQAQIAVVGRGRCRR